MDAVAASVDATVGSFEVAFLLRSLLENERFGRATFFTVSDLNRSMALYFRFRCFHPVPIPTAGKAIQIARAWLAGVTVAAAVSALS